MMGSILFFVHYALLLLFGVLLSAVFTGLRLVRKNIAILLGLSAFCGALQLIIYFALGEASVWRLYPLITHLPTLLLLCLYYRRRPVTALAAVTTAYLCCQPAKWFGLLLETLTDSPAAGQITRILVLLAVGIVAIRFLVSQISEIYSKDTRSVWIFGIVPMVYYLFDYTSSIYTDLWTSSNRTVAEFLPFLLCIVHVAFCVVYYKEYERKTDAEQKEQLTRIAVEQQAKELDAIRRGEQELRLLRHDMRLFLNNLGLCIEENDLDAARKMIAGFTSSVDSTVIRHYCENTMVNYILSDCAAKCEAARITFSPTVELEELAVDENMFSLILSNALDNSIHAQSELPPDRRSIKVLLKTSDGRLLLSVRNPIAKVPPFADGLPVAARMGHGYGTRSIRYLTERMGGNCQFTAEKDQFILRVVI